MENCYSWTSNDDPMIQVRAQKEYSTNSDEIKMAAVQYINLETKDSEWELIDRFSSLSKLLRISIYIFRFLRRLVNKCSAKFTLKGMLQSFPLVEAEYITSEELYYAKLVWSQLTQMHYYKAEIDFLTKNKVLSQSHPWRNLNPSLVDGLIRVVGRLRNSLSYPPIPSLLGCSSNITTQFRFTEVRNSLLLVPEGCFGSSKVD